MSYCCQKLASFHDLNQRLKRLHVLTAPSASISTPAVEIKIEPQLQTLMEINQDEDSVFNDHPIVKSDAGQRKSDIQEDRKQRSSSIRGNIGKDIPQMNKTTQKVKDKHPMGEDPSSSSSSSSTYFSWCNHHNSLLLHLSLIIQTIAVQCPTAFIHCKIKSSTKDTGKRVNVHDGIKELLNSGISLSGHFDMYIEHFHLFQLMSHFHLSQRL